MRLIDADLKKVTMEEVKENIKTLFSKKPEVKYDIYHFHKDCKYYAQCKEEVVYQGKSKRIRFSCPKMKHSQLYVPGDLHTIKWECDEFEPYQETLELQLERSTHGKSK